MVSVLFAENSFFIQEIGKRYLENMGHSVDTASNGSQMVEMARLERPDVIIIGMGVIEADNWRSCYALKLLKSTLDIPLIACGTLDREAHNEYLLKFGIKEYIKLPLTTSLLREHIKKVFQEPYTKKQLAA